MVRPLSPALNSSGEPHSTPSSASRRLVRQLVVDAEAQSEGVTARLYCKVVLPAATSSIATAEHHLLSLVPLSSLTASAAYALPLHPADPGLAHTAARHLSLPGGVPPKEGGETLRRVRRRSSAASDLLSRLSGSPGQGAKRRSAVVSEREGEVLLTLVPAAAGDETPTGPEGTPRPTSPAGSGATSSDFIVVLELEAAFGALRLPRFANSVTISTPLCLRSELAFTLPSPFPPADASAWDLSIRPSLSNVDSTDLAGATQVTGSFPSSPSLSLRWAPQLPPGQDAPLVVPHATIETAWTVDEHGSATADVHISGDFELTGLREKLVVELNLGADELLEVMSCEGDEDTAVLGYELIGAGQQRLEQPMITRSSTATSGSSASTQSVSSASSPLIPPLPRELEDFASPLDDSLLSLTSTSATSSAPTSFPFTPTPTSRRRPTNPRASESRPPSFTSLFDTAPPAPPVLDTSFAEMQPSPGKEERRRDAAAGRERGLSLMKTPAPFDPEASAMDMSFEMSASEPDADGVEASEPPSPARDTALLPEESLPSDADVHIPARMCVQLDVSAALRRYAARASSSDPPSAPTFAFRFTLSSAAPSFGASATRLSLPTISLPAAHTEDALVSVSPASPAWRIEVLPTAVNPADVFDAKDADAPPSPLPAAGGGARWAATRSKGGAVRRPVEIELRPVKADAGLMQLEEKDDAAQALLAEVSPQLTCGIDLADDEELALEQSTRTERPSSPTSLTASPPRPTSPPRPASPSPSPAPNPTVSLSHVRVEVTPLLPPTSSLDTPQRLLYRYKFAQPYTGEIRAPMTVRPLRCWDASGAELELGTVGPLGLVLATTALKEAVYEVESPRAMAGDGETVRLELLKVEAEVATLDVVIKVPKGYELDSDDLGDFVRSDADGAVSFTSFSTSSTSLPSLIVVARPLPPSPITIADPPGVHLAQAQDTRRPTSVLAILRSLALHIVAALAALVIFRALAPAAFPPVNAPSLAAPPALSTFVPSLASTTSLLRTPVTRTATVTATEHHYSTVLVTSTRHITSVSATTTTRTVTLILSPSSSTTPPPRPPFSDDFAQLIPGDARTDPARSASLAHDTAADLLASFRVWVERVKLRARGWWTALRGWAAL